MIFQDFTFQEFSLYLGFKIAMLEIAKQPLRSMVRLASKWMATIAPLIT
jgi:hypothetical protein